LKVETGSLRRREVPLTRWTKVWIVVTLCSVLAYNFYWLYSALVNPYYLSYGDLPENLLQLLIATDYMLPVIGNIFRLIGVSLALLSLYLVWGPKPNPFSNVKKKTAVALLFEGIYFLSLLPVSILIVFYLGPLPILTAFILQALLVSPLLTVLSFKIWRYRKTAEETVLKWAGVAAIGYVIDIWIINVFRGLSTINIEGIGYLISDGTSLSFLNSIITLSLSLIFAVAGFYTLQKKGNKRLSTRLIAIALIMLGLHFVIFIFYSAIINAWNWILVTEVWPIALLGLGLSVLKEA
jgi:hypothetical protein